MLSILLLFVNILSLSAVSALPVEGGCPDGTWTSSNSSCYRLIHFNEVDAIRGGRSRTTDKNGPNSEISTQQQVNSWESASSYCRTLSENSKLITITSEGVDKIAHAISDSLPYACWIGLRKRKASDTGWWWLEGGAPLSDESYLGWGESLRLIWRILPPMERCGMIDNDGWGAKTCRGIGSRLPCFICQSDAAPVYSPPQPPDAQPPATPTGTPVVGGAIAEALKESAEDTILSKPHSSADVDFVPTYFAGFNETNSPFPSTSPSVWETADSPSVWDTADSQQHSNKYFDGGSLSDSLAESASEQRRWGVNSAELLASHQDSDTQRVTIRSSVDGVDDEGKITRIDDDGIERANLHSTTGWNPGPVPEKPTMPPEGLPTSSPVLILPFGEHEPPRLRQKQTEGSNVPSPSLPPEDNPMTSFTGSDTSSNPPHHSRSSELNSLGPTDSILEIGDQPEGRRPSTGHSGTNSPEIESLHLAEEQAEKSSTDTSFPVSSTDSLASKTFGGHPEGIPINPSAGYREIGSGEREIGFVDLAEQSSKDATVDTAQISPKEGDLAYSSSRPADDEATPYPPNSTPSTSSVGLGDATRTSPPPALPAWTSTSFDGPREDMKTTEGQEPRIPPAPTNGAWLPSLRRPRTPKPSPLLRTPSQGPPSSPRPPLSLWTGRTAVNKIPDQGNAAYNIGMLGVPIKESEAALYPIPLEEAPPAYPIEETTPPPDLHFTVTSTTTFPATFATPDIVQENVPSPDNSDKELQGVDDSTTQSAEIVRYVSPEQSESDVFPWWPIFVAALIVLAVGVLTVALVLHRRKAKQNVLPGTLLPMDQDLPPP